MVDKSQKAGARNLYEVAKAMPASRIDIEAKTGIPRQTVAGIIRRMKSRGNVEIVGTIPRGLGLGGAPQIIYRYIGKMPANPPKDAPPPRPPKPRMERIAVPVTPYRTIWVGGCCPVAA